MGLMDKVTPQLLYDLKSSGKRFACLSAYDMPSAKLAEEAGIEVILVGDSVGMVVMGLDSTRPVTFDNMVYHAQAVKRGLKQSLLVIDMPYETTSGTPSETVEYAKRFLTEAGADAVKIEGPVYDVIEQLVAAGIPVMGHLGLTPQSAESFKVQAKTQEEAVKLLENAIKIQTSGAFALVLECIPWQLAEEVTKSLNIPTVGIGAGPHCDSQILVWHDLLGWNPDKKYKFVRRYLNFGEQALAALRNYKNDVIEGKFPSKEESFTK
jgi:3-methyl-2-oxobutanoate hydroxymethyltransferase